jgi:hypothetical protein
MVLRYTHARERRVNQAVDAMERAKTNVEHLPSAKTEDS